MNEEEAAIARLDRAMEIQGRRIIRLSTIAKLNPKVFITHIQRVLMRTRKAEYQGYVKQIQTIAQSLKKDKMWQEHKRQLQNTAEGAAIYLKLKLSDRDYYVIADAAGISKGIIDRLIDQRANSLYPSTKAADIFYSPKDKVSNDLWAGGIPFGMLTPIKTFKDAKNNLYGVVAMLKDAEGNNATARIKSPEAYTDDDRQVHDAIASLWESPTAVISSEQIYRAICKNPKAKLTTQSAREIETSMFKCRRGELTIVTDPAGGKEIWEKGAQGKLKPEKKIFNVANNYNGLLIPFDSWSSGEFHDEHGAIRDRWQVFRPPVLYDYGHDKKQIAATPIQGISRKVNRSKSTRSLMGYLDRQIDTMKKTTAKVFSRNITWEALYKVDGVYDGDTKPQTIKAKQSKTRTKVIKLLDERVAAGLIKGYTYNKHDGEHMKKVGRNWAYHSIGISVGKSCAKSKNE